MDRLLNFSDQVKAQFSQHYFQSHFQNIGEHSKLRTYVKFKLNANREDYLDIQDISLKHRKLFCSFRISCHDLEIERGRYCSPHKEPEDRICKICNIQTETEEHFMLFCPKYRKLRLQLIRDISEIDPNIYNIPHSSRFIYMMNNRNVEITKTVMDFLLRAYTERALILGGKL